MRRLAFALIACVALQTAAAAHNGIEHLRGTVTQIGDKTLTIQMTASKSETITLAADTVFQKSGAKATLQDVKVGDKVVVDAVVKGKSITAKAVKFGAAAAATGSAAHKHK